MRPHRGRLGTQGLLHRRLAAALFDRVAKVANDLGLLAEEYDSGAGRQTGNFAQALTHIALINTAHNLNDASKRKEKPAVQGSK